MLHRVIVFAAFGAGLLFLSPTLTHAQLSVGCGNYASICSLKPLPAGAKPGSTCADGNGNYVYGTSNSCGPGQATPCIPRCNAAPADAWCCDPKPGYTPASGYPPGCTKVVNGSCVSVATGIGPISTDPSGLVGSVVGLLLGFSGGIAILLIIAAGYQLMVSQGNPEKVKEGRERLIAAIVGLLFIIFSITLLQIVGVSILHIPGFNP